LKPSLIVLAIVVASGCSSKSSGPQAFSGVWEMDMSRSSDIDQWRDATLTLQFRPDSVLIKRDFGAGRYKRAESFALSTDGRVQDVAASNSSKWLDNVHLGVFFREGSENAMSAQWNNDQSEFTWQWDFVLQTSTGQAAVTTTRNFTLIDSGKSLQMVETRSSRDQPLTFVFTRQGGDK
jgi:hypothetical protein